MIVRLLAATGLLIGWAVTQPVAEPFQDYREEIAKLGLEFKMVAVQGGRFSGESVEGAEVEPFWIGETEVTWDEYEFFYFGEDPLSLSPEVQQQIDAISRPTPPYAAPDQGWGTGRRPALSMTHYAARQYCRWLSALTGKSYRLATEREWEWALRSGLNPEVALGDRSVYRDNSQGKSQPVAGKQANRLGLFDLLGNVSEFCSDPYDDRVEPDQPLDYVIKGGSYLDPAELLQIGIRRPANEAGCRKTDPQIPKSRWWYSDCFHIGFRVARSTP